MFQPFWVFVESARRALYFNGTSSQFGVHCGSSRVLKAENDIIYLSLFMRKKHALALLMNYLSQENDQRFKNE